MTCELLDRSRRRTAHRQVRARLRLRPLWEHPPALTSDQQWEQWREDIDRTYTETVYAFRNRLVYRELSRIFKANQRLSAEGGFIWNWIKGVYGRDQVLAVGREVDRHTEVINLIQLTYQMTRRPKVISRERFFKMLDLENPAKKRSDLLIRALREQQPPVHGEHRRGLSRHRQDQQGP
jgi:hypothetical protein